MKAGGPRRNGEAREKGSQEGRGTGGQGEAEGACVDTGQGMEKSEGRIEGYRPGELAALGRLVKGVGEARDAAGRGRSPAPSFSELRWRGGEVASALVVTTTISRPPSWLSSRQCPTPSS